MIVVSHNLGLVQALCRRAVLLERGEVMADGPVRETLDHYLRELERAAAEDLLQRTDRDGRAYDETLVRRLEIRDASGGSPDVVVAGRPAVIVVHVTKALPQMQCRLTILDNLGQAVTTFDSEVPAPADIRDADLGTQLECEIDALPLLPGRYRIDILLKANRVIQDGLQAAAFFDVEPGVLDGRPIQAVGGDGTVAVAHTLAASALIVDPAAGTTRFLAPRPTGATRPSADAPTFSIVVAAYQAATTIAETVQSALAQVRPADEIVVVDDGSTDDLVGALQPLLDEVKLIRKPNGGGASALNAGAAVASSEFIAILDADDVYHPRRIDALAALAIERPDLDLITTDARFVVDGRGAGRFYDHNTFSVDDQRSAILQSCFVGGWPAIRVSRLRAIGGFDEDLRTGYDWDCWLRLIFDGSRAGLVDSPFYDYRLHDASLTASRHTSLWDRVRLLEKARHEPSLDPRQRGILEASIRTNRSRAVFAEIADGRRSGVRRRRLLALACMSGLGLGPDSPQAAGTLAPTSVAQRLSREAPPAERLRLLPLRRTRCDSPSSFRRSSGDALSSAPSRRSTGRSFEKLFEVVVVVDGSTDGTAAALREGWRSCFRCA